jgi:hypothetical protein
VDSEVQVQVGFFFLGGSSSGFRPFEPLLAEQSLFGEGLSVQALQFLTCEQ